MTIAPRRIIQLSSNHQINKLTFVSSNSKPKYTNYRMVSIFNIFFFCKILHIPIPIILIQLVIGVNVIQINMGHLLHCIFPIGLCVNEALHTGTKTDLRSGSLSRVRNTQCSKRFVRSASRLEFS